MIKYIDNWGDWVTCLVSNMLMWRLLPVCFLI